jgi:hypothetical protein
VHVLAALLISTVAVGAAMFGYERKVARPALERLWGRVRSGEVPTPDPGWGLFRRLRGWVPYFAGIIDSPASSREAQIAAVGVAVVALLPAVVWIILAVWLYQAF